MIKIGLTGGIGCGKTTVSNLFAEYNQNNDEDVVAIIDTDIIARQIVTPGTPAYQQIRDLFGDNILNKDTTINRAILRKLVFNNPDSRIALNKITHPAIQKEVQEKLGKLDVKYCIIVIPLLLETESDYKLDRILVIDCDESLQLSRTAKRDRISEQDVKLILQAQASRQQRLKYADDIISNNGDIDSLRKQVEQLHHLYLNIEK